MNASSFNRFTVNPTNIDIKRSTFDRSSQHKTTFNVGKLIPIYVDEVLPGDTFKMDTSFVVRLSNPIVPVMDNLFMDIYYFFVPNRLVWDHWKQFNGENTTGPWYQSTEYLIPQMFNGTEEEGTEYVRKGSIHDYFGIPTGIYSASDNSNTLSWNALPERAYWLIWNEWFRDQNLQYPVFIPTGDDDDNTSLDDREFPLAVNKYHDYFTSCLPAPQKGPAVTLPVVDKVPVVTAAGQASGTALYTTVATSPSLTNPNGLKNVYVSNAVNPGTQLFVDLSEATFTTINQLREAFAVQRLFERDARGGTRYTEMIRAHFGVTSPDARQQRPEYLGGKRIPLNISQVLQTSESGSTPLGQPGAVSCTSDYDGSFVKSFTEHGYIIGVACVRPEHTYQYGIERMWSRRRRFDFYYPALANIGEQPVLNKEIFVGDGSATHQPNGVFGFQEAWADYRYKPNRVSSAFRSSYAQSLDFWHFADKFSSRPVLGADFIKETYTNVDRCLAVQAELEDQIIADFLFKCTATRPMPVYSVPGLLDHN